jgi:AraC family transcriptional activator of pobA
MTQRTIPSYELYGELLSGASTDPIHHELIRDRSSQHDWTIRLHRHRAMAQVFLFRTANVAYRLGDVTHRTSEPHILFVPPGFVHGFRFDEDVDGDVLSIRTGDLPPGPSEALLPAAMQVPCVLARSDSENFADIEATFQQLARIYRRMNVERRTLLETLTQLILTYIAGDVRRHATIGTLPTSERLSLHEQQAEDFCALVEQDFREERSVGDYARKLGVSPPHLTRVCRKVLGESPNGLIRQRRLLEAKRLLEYTRLSISEIALRSGFRNPPFFSRTFRQCVGLSPKSYRSSKEA